MIRWYENKKQKDPIRWEEYRRVLLALEADGDWRNLMMWTLAGYTAFRVSDWRELSWGLVLGTDEMSVVEKKTRYMNKSARRVMFGKEVRRIIELCCSHMNPSGYPDLRIFVARRGKKVDPMDRRIAAITANGVNKVLRLIAKKYELDYPAAISSHCLRKTFARRVFDMHNGSHEGLLLCSEMLGHSDVRTTMLYIGITESKIKNTYESL